MIYTKYWFWLVVISLLVMGVERLLPWRKSQPVLREGLAQDVFWIVFNGYLFALLAWPLMTSLFALLSAGFAAVAGEAPQTVRLLAGLPWWVQLPVGMLVVDFVEWSVHNALHRSNLLWKIHRVHHSIHTMDWVGNFRFHWGEIVIYGMVRYLPLTVLGIPPTVGLVAAAIATLIGHLNHSNIDISWGPLRYLLSSSRMHLFHHDVEVRGRAGVNFAIVFSVWDWLFRTAFMPLEQTPERIGYEGDEKSPKGLLWRFFLPFWDRSSGTEGEVSGSQISSWQ